MAKLPEVPPVDLSSVHKRAEQIVAHETVLAYAVSVQLRKHIVGRKGEIKYELLTRLAYESWNRFQTLQAQADQPTYTRAVLDLISDVTLSGYEILTDARIR